MSEPGPCGGGIVVPARPRRRLMLAAVLMGAVGSGGVVRGDGKAPPGQLTAVGNDSILWLMVGRWDSADEKLLQDFCYIERQSTKISPALRIEPQVGRVDRVALAGEDLHVFFSREGTGAATPGAHYRYSIGRGIWRERRLPGDVVPEALAGESGGASLPLWVVVGAATADAVEAAWQEEFRRRATRTLERDRGRKREAATAKPAPSPSPGEISAAPATMMTPRPEGTYHLVQYDGYDWQPGMAAPADCAGSTGVWLCMAGGRPCLFWQKKAKDSEIRFARHEGGDWVTGPAVRLTGAPQAGSACVVNTQLHFIALVRSPDDGQRVRCEAWVWLAATDEGAAGRWEALPAPQDEAGSSLDLPAGSAVGAFGDQLAFLRLDDEGEAEVSLWPTGGGAAEPFRKVPVPETHGGTKSGRDLTEFVALVVLAAVMFMVFWRRRQSITYPVALPEGWIIAGLGRRAVAALVDAAPAGVVVAWWWYQPLAEYGEQIWIHRNSPEDLQRLVMPAALFWASIAFRLFYAGYCTVFELLWSATPGKRLMGCTVLSESVARPTVGQIAIRNASRLVELEPALLIWPFLLVLFITRNRQRIGDLLARTIVVTKPTSLPPGQRAEQGPHGSQDGSSGQGPGEE